MSYDWYIGQKIVCINNDVSGIDKTWVTPLKFIQSLTVGQIYTIQDMGMNRYTDIEGEHVSFLLKEIDTKYQEFWGPDKNGLDEFGSKHYHFHHRRFKSLEEDTTETENKIDISLFHGLLKEVNDGTKKFDDEEVEKHMKPKRQKEFT